MNNYEALTRLSTIDLQQYGDDPFGDGRLTPLYACDCYREEFVTLLNLIDNHEKYKWHDLRKDPNDLPSESVTVLLIFDCCGKHYIVGKYYKESDDECPWFVDIDDCPYADQVIEEFENIIAWKYIEEFKGE